MFAIAAYDDRAARDRALGDWLEDRGVDLVVLAGFMELLGHELIHRFGGRIAQRPLHRCCRPSRASGRSEQALAYGVKVMGVTVHFVDEGVDSGPIVLQESFALPILAASPRSRSACT